MKVISSERVSDSCFDNRKSKTCTEPNRSIQNRKWARLFAIVVVLTVCGARADAQQTGKSFRIGVLDKHCFRKLGPPGCVPPRVEQAWMD